MSANQRTWCPKCQPGHRDEESDGTFLEYFEVFGAATGHVTVDYQGRCRNCGAHVEFQTTHEVAS